ncbi:hypothetical protein C6502_14230 [Candidatus Poribacteria bacterium]|nr:MAG: hypothetical protein C6502_14230 [Candidatus Poribacteria bacterium]
MTTTIDKLLIKTERIERELAEVRQALEELRPTKPLTPEERAAARLEHVKLKNEKLAPLIDEAFKKMGITGEPIGAEKLQEMLAAEGVKPEENSFSRGIIKMREE